MTDNSSQLVKLSRRKVLAGLGAVGIASAGAGLGTSAYFSDRELLGSNEFVTGELDLLVDWQQHYTMDGETTFVNAHPDHDGDGEQSIVVDGEAVTYSDFVDSEDPTGTGRNIPLLDCETVPPLSEAAFGVDPTTGDPQEALIQLGDVKPGDTGEVTFSLHLCDNPGYVWMQADNISESEGIDTQPELAVDETTGADLARNIEAKLWYDTDCDNVHDTNGASDIMLVIDFSGSMLYRQFGGVVSEDPITPNGQTYDETTKIDLVELGAREFVQYLIDQGADAQVGVAYFDGEGSDDTVPRTGILQPLTTNLTAVDTAVSNLRQKLANVVTGGPGSTPFDGDGDPDPDTGGSGITTGTYIGEGLDDAQSQLATNGRSGVPASSIVLSDGESFNGTGSTQFVSPQDAAADARAGAPAPETNV
jgi:predicted ribosomally synthesized peptide with SipW-like signal peptide